MSPQEIIKWRRTVKLFISDMGHECNCEKRCILRQTKNIMLHGCRVYVIAGWRLDFKAPFTGELTHMFHKYECALWRIRLGLSLDMLASIAGFNVGPRADSACTHRCWFQVHRREAIWTLRPFYSVSKLYVSQVWVNYYSWVMAFVWYAWYPLFSGWIGLGRSCPISCWRKFAVACAFSYFSQIKFFPRSIWNSEIHY